MKNTSLPTIAYAVLKRWPPSLMASRVVVVVLGSFRLQLKFSTLGLDDTRTYLPGERLHVPSRTCLC